MCFIRITAKVPFNDQFDVSVIHDREEVSAGCVLYVRVVLQSY